MAGTTSIEWTDATWNPVTGCTKISRGCRHCYIDRTPPFRMQGRRFVRGATGVRLHEDRLAQPLGWGKPRRVFVCSLADLFHEDVPDDFIAEVFRAMGLAPAHTFQVLTKRPERALDFLDQRRWRQFDYSRDFRGRPCFPVVPGKHRAGDIPLPNVWVGVSIEDARYTWRADVLRQIPAAVRFISAEPLLGSLFPTVDERCPDCWHPASAHGGFGCDVELDDVAGDCGCPRRFAKPLDLRGIDWIIVGGESGPGARPFHLEHAREIIRAAEQEQPNREMLLSGADHWPAVFVKQLGARPIDSYPSRAAVAFLGGEGAGVALPLHLRDRKGGDIDEWPADLRIREFPAVRAAA